ncbi:hypothetical protein P167DRAFT_532833 [Morchella conica CCBAS932]|uniref:Uncharacterized protein n=1 Tax=Morchella conica CCBAS932 TaxID=1392247 RepID=A0A3N4KZC1_9PEZI|nr:hypothetical protein P167DRAFT_532833 [Morchella conica CCBAS932]
MPAHHHIYNHHLTHQQYPATKSSGATSGADVTRTLIRLNLLRKHGGRWTAVLADRLVG